MAHWLHTVIKLLDMDTLDLRTLAVAAGGDPKTFYKGASLIGVDVRGQDLTGMEFSPDQVRYLVRDENTKLDVHLDVPFDGQAAFRRALASLTPREERMIRMYLGIDVSQSQTLKEIGAQFGVSKDRARQIVNKGRRKLVEALGPNEAIVSEAWSQKDSDSKTASQVEKVLKRLSVTPRQEERLAIVLKAFLSSPIVGKIVLEIYRTEKAKFAHQQFAVWRAAFPSNVRSTFETSQLAAELIRLAVPRAYPLSKGVFLYMLAKHLWSFSLTNDVIRASLDRSVSMFVEPYRADIKKMLDRRPQRRPAL
jgi:DNA-binding CsgD family transcriptional regulator